MPAILKPGVKAPDFSLNATPDQKLSLHDFKGKNLIIAFYPNDWSPVCSSQMVLYNQILPEFKKYNAEIVGISVDSSWCHLAFSKENNIHFPLLSDFEPKGETAKKFGAYGKSGTCERALFVLDKKGNIVWSYLSPIGENPGADGILEALQKLEKTHHAVR